MRDTAPRRLRHGPHGQTHLDVDQLTHFAIETAQDDRSLLSSLIASPAYAHDYASPFDAAAVVTEPAVHGRWWRSSIHPELFMPWKASDAESLIQGWADDQDWTDPDFRQPHLRAATGHSQVQSS